MSEPTEQANYDRRFFEDLDEPASSSAAVVLEIVEQYVQPKSVVDVGCGTGQWLLEAKRRFDAEIMGIDGEWNTQLDSLEGLHQTVDFEMGLSIGRKFDLAICLEVAEHLTPSAGEQLVGELCRASDVVLFSAAVEDQPGEHHINCQAQSVWMEHFERRQFRCFDFIRPQIWDDPQVAWWYRQNIFLAVSEASALCSELTQQSLSACQPRNIVHPENYSTMMRAMAVENKRVWDELYETQQSIEQPSARLAATVFKNYALRSARRARYQARARLENRKTDER